MQEVNLGGTGQLVCVPESRDTTLTSRTGRSGRWVAFAGRAPVSFDGRVVGGERDS